MARAFANTSGTPNIDFVTYSGVPAVSGLSACSVVLRVSGNSATPAFGNAIRIGEAGAFDNDVTVLRFSTSNELAYAFRNSSSSPLMRFPFVFDGSMRSVVCWFDGSAGTKEGAYLNGVEQSRLGTAHTSATIGTGQNVCIIGGDTNFRWNGTIAECAVYNRIITLEEAQAHAGGASCLNFPRGLIFYAPMIREVHDIAGGLTGTITGTTVAEHPRVYL